MPKLRDDLLRKLSPDDQALMKKFRKTPLKAYTAKELQPENYTGLNLFLELRLESLVSQGLLMKFFSEGEIYFAKAKGRPRKNNPLSL
jgi:hypothetical protein